MADYFVKLHKKILTSSIWEQSPATRLVWVALLVSADPDGLVSVSRDAVWRLANVSREEALSALEVLESPDPYSKTKSDDGRRIEEVEGGFLVLNYVKYRSPELSQTPGAIRTRNSRARNKQNINREVDRDRDRECNVTNVTDVTPVTQTKKHSKQKRWRVVPDDWEPTDAHAAKASQLGIDMARELDMFRNHEFAAPKSDASRAFSNWLSRAAEMAHSWPQNGRSSRFSPLGWASSRLSESASESESGPVNGIGGNAGDFVDTAGESGTHGDGGKL